MMVVKFDGLLKWCVFDEEGKLVLALIRAGQVRGFPTHSYHMKDAGQGIRARTPISHLVAHEVRQVGLSTCHSCFLSQAADGRC